MTKQTLQEKDRRADEVIRNWSWGALAVNVLPPPVDKVAVTAAIARMGKRLADVYAVEISNKKASALARAVTKGLGGASVAAAAYAGTSLLKWVPGVGFWTALLVQPPLVGALSYAAGQSFKQYYRSVITGSAISPDELSQIAEEKLRERLHALASAKRPRS